MKNKDKKIIMSLGLMTVVLIGGVYLVKKLRPKGLKS